MPERTWIVVPCFNEAARLDRAAFEHVLHHSDGPVFLFVDDGSTDDTLAVLRALNAAPGRCHVLPLRRNRGKAEAVRSGLLHALEAGALFAGYWDADLATPLAVVDQFRAELLQKPAIDAVIGARVRMLGREIDRSGVRHLVGRAYATAASLVLRLPVYDTQCGAKLFRASPALAAALETPFRSRWGFDVELISRLQRCWGESGIGRIVEVPLAEWHDVAGSKVSLRAGMRAFLSLAGLALRPPQVRLPSPTNAATEPGTDRSPGRSTASVA